MRGRHCVVAVSPDPRVLGVISGPVDIVPVRTPEPQGHRRKGSTADQLPGFAVDRSPLVIPNLNSHSQCRTLDLSGADREGGVTADKAPAQVGTTGNRRQMDVRLDGVVHIPEALCRER